MNSRQIAVWIGGLMVLSGCATGGARQELSRLQSQVGLLDDRVTQLERSSLSAAPSGASSEGLAAPAPAVTPMPIPRASREQRMTAKASVKPSTREIQQALRSAGLYQGSVDGKMGPATRQAIKEFQRLHGLKDDGVVGKQTWAKLSSYADLSPAERAPSAAEGLK